MLDWIYSKVAISIAVLVVVATIVAFFTLQRNTIERTELNNIADIIAFNVNLVSKKTDEFITNVTFAEGSPQVVQLPGMYKNEPYNLKIQPDQVVISQGSEQVASSFTAIIHCWNPKLLGQYSYYTNETIIWGIDQTHNELSFKSGNDFLIHQKKLNINGSVVFRTFIYLASEV
ncbi:MAG: hypothetical protein QW728_02650 [Thermoplasmata archaeon]